ncbi:MAG: serine protease [Brevefilum sp.]|nr:serine protease [Brevefilum sp.]
MADYADPSTPSKNRTVWVIGCAVVAIVGLCLLVFLLVGGFAWLLTAFNGGTDGLTVVVDTPTADVQVGDIFFLEVSMTNGGTRNVTITEIRLPRALLENAQVISVDPAGSIGPQSAFTYDMTIAPTGRETVVFSLQALTPGNASGEVEVHAGRTVISSPIRINIAPALVEEVETVETPPPAMLPGDVIPYRAVVQIIAIINLNGQLVQGWTGSGTVISEDGLILTNAHVVFSDRFFEVADLVVSITTAQDQPPEPMFFADVVQGDARLDLAVIKVRSDLEGNPANFSALGIEPVKIGQAESLQLGDPIVILGYPGIGGETITLTRGEVSGFTAEAPYGNRAFIKTSATIAGGNSGGLAATPQGEIIGIPTQVGSGELEGVIVDCRPLADTNRDGVIDERDNCVPTGGFINALRPINLAQPLIEAALAGQVAIIEETDPEEPQEMEPEGELVLFDDFSDNRNDWFVGDFTEGNVEITDGQLVISVDKEKTYIFSTMLEVYSNLIMVVDARVLQPTGDGDYGFICGYVDDQNYTVLEISEDGYYTIWALVADQEIYLVDWTASDMIPSSGDITLAAYCGSDGFALAVNDTLLASVDASHYKPGQVGLFTGTWNQANIRIGFDNFAIFEP